MAGWRIGFFRWRAGKDAGWTIGRRRPSPPRRGGRNNRIGVGMQKTKRNPSPSKLADRRPRRPRRWIFIAVGLIILAFALVGVFERVSNRRKKPVVESLKLDGLDPMVAAAIDEAQGAVRDSPQSGA